MFLIDDFSTVSVDYGVERRLAAYNRPSSEHGFLLNFTLQAITNPFVIKTVLAQ